MAKRLFHATNWTPTATADATNLVNNTYMALLGGSTTQLINILEVMMHPSTAALAAPPSPNVAVATPPQRSNATSQGRLELGLNAFGGIMKWNPYTPDMAFSILGNTAPLGEVSLSAFTGGTVGNISAHIIYEPL